MTTNKNEIRNEIVATFDQSIADMKACTNNDFILAYPAYGIGIALDEKNNPRTTTLVNATTIVPEQNNMPEEAWAFTPIVKNGSGEQAKILPRQRAIAAHIIHLEACRAEMLAA